MKLESYERGQLMLHAMARVGTMAVIFLLILEGVSLPFAWHNPVTRVVDVFAIGVVVVFGGVVWIGTRLALKILDRSLQHHERRGDGL